VQQGPEAVAEAHEAASEEEAASKEEAEATQIRISFERTVGAAKRITTELPGATAKLVAAVLQPGITITKPQIEVRLAATIGEPPTASDLAAAT
jgi:head-tail adaptor